MVAWDPVEVTRHVGTILPRGDESSCRGYNGNAWGLCRKKRLTWQHVRRLCHRRSRDNARNISELLREINRLEDCSAQSRGRGREAPKV